MATALLLGEVKITTTRLVLQAISSQWAADIFREFTAEITHYMHPKPPQKLDDSQAFIRQALAGLSAGSDLQLVILDRATRTFIGCCGLHGLLGPRPELGVWIQKSSHGHSYGLEAISSLIRWAKAYFSFECLRYPVDRRNFASRRIAELNGGKIQTEYKNLNQSGAELDLVEYWIR